MVVFPGLKVSPVGVVCGAGAVYLGFCTCWENHMGLAAAVGRNYSYKETLREWSFEKWEDREESVSPSSSPVCGFLQASSTGRANTEPAGKAAGVCQWKDRLELRDNNWITGTINIPAIPVWASVATNQFFFRLIRWKYLTYTWCTYPRRKIEMQNLSSQLSFTGLCWLFPLNQS